MAGTARFALTLAILVPLLLGAGQAAAFPCEKEVRKKLAEMKISKPSIASVRVIRELGEDDAFLGYDVWTRVKSCKGQYVMNLTEACLVTNGYSRLSCMGSSGQRRR